MKKIPLTQGKFALIDDEDFDKINQYKWHLFNNHDRGLYARSSGKILMHRMILDLIDPKIKIDHINHDGLDNTRLNLRICTDSQNQQNRNKPKKICTSKYKNVSWKKQNNKWQSYINFNKKRIFLGYFSKEMEAAKAYDNAAKELFGKFARLNFDESINNS